MNVIKQQIDRNLDQCLPEGSYRFYAPDGGTLPPGYVGANSDFIMVVHPITPDGGDALGGGRYWQRQTLIDVRSDKTFKRTVMEGSFGIWVEQATATPPQEYNLPLAAGYVGGEGCAWYFKEQNNKVTLTVSDVQKSDGAGFVTGIIGTLPAGYRPSKLISVACSMWTGNQAPGLLQALPNGDVWITVAATGCRSIHGQLTFVAA